MKMKTVKTTADYTIYQRRDGRYAISSAAGAAINGDDKVKILLAEDLIKVSQPAAPVAEAAAEEAAAPAEEAATEGVAAEAPAEDNSSDT